MRDDSHSPIERRLHSAWFRGRSPWRRDLAWLARRGFQGDCPPLYSWLDAWVGAFAVRDIQLRLPNC